LWWPPAQLVIYYYVSLGNLWYWYRKDEVKATPLSTHKSQWIIIIIIIIIEFVQHHMVVTSEALKG